MRLQIISYIFIMGAILQSCAQTTQQKQKISNHMIQLSKEDWKKKLTPQQYYVLREKGTERPFTGKLLSTKEKGVYKCAGCNTSLFTDEMKFDSHCGWPSFDKEIKGGKIIKTTDTSHGMIRTEITCANCGGHLGHIFDDGPTDTGVRYCVNSASLNFEPEDQQKAVSQNQTEIITLAGGCFWCIEAIFENLKGVEKAVSGYCGGDVENPTYKQVCTGTTNHAEVVQITYTPSIISLEELLEVFFTLHDPTTLNRQGADIGTQYRSAIFYHNQQQKETSKKVIKVLEENHVFKDKIVTEITEFEKFYPAEDYHQQYYDLNKEQPFCRGVIKPKIDKLHKIFNKKLK